MRIWVVGGTSGIGAAVASMLRMPAHPGSRIHEVYASGLSHDVREVNTWDDDPDPEGIVYSAGINRLDWVQDIEPEEMLSVFDINVVGLIRVLQASPRVKRVVVIGSDAAWRPMRTSIMYNASKAALHETVRCIARERASDDFAINVVAPGLVEGTHMTEYVHRRTAEIREDLDLSSYMHEQIPMARAGHTWEVAEVVCKVLEMETNYLNGAVIPVNGAR